MTDATLSVALERAARALDGDDARGAAAALRQVTAACEAALRKDLRIAPEALGPLRRLYERCGAAAETARQRLGAALHAAGHARRAAAAYRR